MNDLKVRICGDLAQMNILTEKLREMSKQWGSRKIFRIRRYKRQHNPKAKYDRSFGDSEYIYYIRMKVLSDEQRN